MNKLPLLHREAVEQTKKKIEEDLEAFLETKAERPTYEEYLMDSNKYYRQLWTNVWLNLITNKVPKIEKKRFLVEQGYEVVGVDRKIINKLFRNEMRDYKPFNAFKWLKEMTPDEQQWNEKYVLAREAYFKKLELERIAKEKRRQVRVVEDVLSTMIYSEQELLYIMIRYEMAKQLKNDIDQHNLLKDHSGDTAYLLVSDLTDEWVNNDQEVVMTYYDHYELLIEKHLSKVLMQKLNEKLNAQLTSLSALTEIDMRHLVLYSFQDLLQTFIGMFQEEYMNDLLQLAEMSNDLDEQLAFFHINLSERVKRKEDKQAQIEKERAKETLMLDDIFGREYGATVGKSVKYVLHIGETNTGKTFHALEKMKRARSGIYLAPLRLLALEVFEKLNKEGVPCSLKTGEEEKDTPGASHVSCTVEMFYAKDEYDVIVIDEAQLIADKDRGFSWYKAITKATAKEVHIIGSRNVKTMLLQLLTGADITIHEYSREVPLQIEKREFQFNQTKKGDALVCFSRKRVLETASQLQNNGYSVSMIYGSMPPETRKKQINRFIQGETSVIVATDAIGMGLNLPIRRIVFLETEKFDGTRRRRLTSQEVKQIAGRAGRKGIYEVGKVAFTKDVRYMKKLLMTEDEPVQTFAIAPTTHVFERFQKYSRDLGTFFDLWQKFVPPEGTKKAPLHEERELYDLIRGTQIEARLSMSELYHFLHLPFSRKDQALINQWKATMLAIVRGKELPEPVIKLDNLEELELSYKALGLHLLFLYRLGKQTEALYWERLRLEISDQVHDRLNTDVKKLMKTCHHCGRKLPFDFQFRICDSCHWNRKL